MISVVWLRNALDNVRAIHAYYVGEGVPHQAKKVVATIEKTVNQLRELPALGRPGKVSKTRELLVPRTPYIVIYREERRRVEILRVLHVSQKWPGVEDG